MRSSKERMQMSNTLELWRVKRVLAATGLSRTLLYQLMAAGRFPRSVPLAGTRARAWRSTEVQQWINQQT
jgi:prophage regulatory protein